MDRLRAPPPKTAPVINMGRGGQGHFMHCRFSTKDHQKRLLSSSEIISDFRTTDVRFCGVTGLGESALLALRRPPTFKYRVCTASRVCRRRVDLGTSKEEKRAMGRMGQGRSERIFGNGGKKSNRIEELRTFSLIEFPSGTWKGRKKTQRRIRDGRCS